MYKFARFENDTMKKYEFSSYKDAKKWIDDEIEKYKHINHVKDETKDKSFMNYKESLEKLIDDYEKCKICPEIDHEGAFCRCESRNIRIAKKQRELNQSSLQSK
jgi:hypothetical protein